jgi:hypothetical protein
MKRRVCSYDMFAVPEPSIVLKDTVGEKGLQRAALTVSREEVARQGADPKPNGLLRLLPCTT